MRAHIIIRVYLVVLSFFSPVQPEKQKRRTKLIRENIKKVVNGIYPTEQTDVVTNELVLLELICRKPLRINYFYGRHIKWE
jgi:hypothetical protein